MEKLISIKDLFIRSFGVYRSKFWILTALVIISLLVFVVAALLLLPFGLVVFFSNFNIMAILVTILIGLILLLGAIVINILSYTSLLFCMNENIPLDIRNIKSLFLKSWNIIGSYVWVCFLFDLIVLLGFVLLIIPGIIFTVWFGFSIFVLIFEGIRGSQALKGSKELVKGYWWAIFGRLLVLVVASVLISMIPIIGDAISILCVTPFSIIYMYLVYEDLKRIKSSTPTISAI